jgi:hypothetical protein
MRWAGLAASVAFVAVCRAEVKTGASLQTEAFAAKGRKDYAACAATMDRIFDGGEESIGALYFGAGCYALVGQNDKAFAVLEKALGEPVNRNSYFNFERLERDPHLDLDRLREDPRWKLLAARTAERRRTFLAAEGSEMFRIYVEDQADRWKMPLDLAWIGARDRERREKTKALIEGGRLQNAEDFNEAAFLFQHGNDYVEVGFAHELALKAYAMDPEGLAFGWTVAATLDRYLWFRCRPQIYGTQFQITDGRYTIEPIDSDLIDDAERARWGVPPLEAAHERERKLNEQLQEQAKAASQIAPTK